MNSMKLVIQLHFISWKNSFSNISKKYILPNMIGMVIHDVPILKKHALAFQHTQLRLHFDCWDWEQPNNALGWDMHA